MNLKVSMPYIILTLMLIWLSATATESLLVLCLAMLLGFVAFMTTIFFSANEKRRNREIKPINGAVILFSIFVCVSVCCFQWPLRITYAASKPALDNLAVKLRQGKAIVTPVRAGFFTIEKAEIRTNNDTVCLWTRPNPGGDEGFVQVAPSKMVFNLWSSTTLDNQWQFITED